MNRSQAQTALVGLIAAILILAVCSSQAVADVELGKPAENFTVHTFEGETIALNSLRGRVVVINFWASWCPGCIFEFPELNELAAAYKDRPVTFIGLSEDVRYVDARAFADRNKPLHMKLAMDPNGYVAGSYNLMGIPSTVVVDRQGIVRLVAVGYRPGDQQRIDRLLKELLQ